MLERDAEIALNEPGTHGGGGETVGYSFFTKVPRLGLVFRKRAFKPGSAIGYHLQEEDEIYYVLSGRGVMTIDGKSFDVDPGTAILTRAGSSHGLKQTGSDDLVILINHELNRGTSLRIIMPSAVTLDDLHGVFAVPPLPRRARSRIDLDGAAASPVTLRPAASRASSTAATRSSTTSRWRSTRRCSTGWRASRYRVSRSQASGRRSDARWIRRVCCAVTGSAAR